MKSAFSLALIVAILSSLPACTTLSNRRDLYSPAKPHGPWTKKGEQVRHSVWHNKILDY